MKTIALLLMTGKFSKFLLTGGTMLISLVTYAWAYGWWYAAGFIAMLFTHEMGHYIAAKQRNLNVGAPCFIPFVGAWINLKEQPIDAETEAYIGIAGPMAGTAAAFACFLYGRETGSHLALAVAYSGFMLNLFNLIPLSPLDGGRIMAAISPKLWLIGLPMLFALYIWRPSPMLIAIGIMAAPQLYAFFKNHDQMNSPYYQVAANTRTGYAVQYLILAGFLAIASFELHAELSGRQ